jgi:hypothetical protein
MSGDIDDLLGQAEDHPSYGMIRCSQVTSGKGVDLFGSSIRHTSTVRIRISSATLRRHLSDDDHYRKNEIIEIELSPAQWAEFLTSMNQGDGVPCTLRFVRGFGAIPEPVTVSKREQFENEFKVDAVRIAKKMDDLVAFVDQLQAQPSISKKERTELSNRIQMIRQEIASNIPFLATQFSRQMDKTVTAARAEADFFVTKLIRDTGLAAIKKGFVALDVAEQIVEQTVLELDDARVGREVDGGPDGLPRPADVELGVSDLEA